jgi:hypothetical protein
MGLRHCRVLDIPDVSTDEDFQAINEVIRLAGSLKALRFPSYLPLPVDSFIKHLHVEHTFVFRCDNWSMANGRLLKPIPRGAGRVVVNVAYQWADQLFAAYLFWPDNIPLIPDTVTHLVFHFRPVGPERPRYLRVLNHLNVHLPNNPQARILERLGTTSAIPTLRPNERFALVIIPALPHVDEPAQSLFAQIAHVYAASGRSFRLTVVGLDKFDEARATEAAGDAAFSAMIPTLNLTHMPPPSRYIHGPFEPIAPSFVESVARLVPERRRDEVRRNVQVLSADEYLGNIGAQQREIEDWWDCEVTSNNFTYC